ncbi:MAG: hypothetical protein ACR2OD_00480, partial [Gaiellaceae bacterium]
GDPGVLGFYIVRQSFPLSNGNNSLAPPEFVVSCNNGDHATGGGYETFGFVPPVRGSRPAAAGTAWQVLLGAPDRTPQGSSESSLTVYVVCAQAPAAS